MKRSFFLLSLCAVLLSLTLPAIADGKVERINRIKAAFILNIARYVEWPQLPTTNNNKQFMLCFYATNPLGKAIKTIHKKRIGKYRLDYQVIDSLSQKTSCNMLFLSQEQMLELANFSRNKTVAEMKQQYASLFDENLLTLGDLSDKPQQMDKIEGIMICLIRQATRIGIEINMSSLNNSRLKLSSELLKLSKRN